MPLPSAATRTFPPAWVLYLGVCVGGMLLCFHPTIFSGLQQIQTDPGDPALNHYFLEHSWLWVSDSSYQATFWSPRFFHPALHTLTYSENMIGTAPIYWALRTVTSEVAAWQWWVLLLAVGNFVAMLVVLRWFGIHPILAAAGAFVFAFGLPRQAQLNHHHLLPQAFSAFAVWYFWKLLQTPGRRSWALLLFFSAWQLLASIHLGWFLGFALGIWAVLAIVVDRGVLGRLWRFLCGNVGFVLMTGTFWALALGWFFSHYFIGNEGARRKYEECLFFMPYLEDWLACPAGSLWGLDLCPSGGEHDHERHLCAGIGFHLLLLIGLIAGIRRLAFAESGPKARLAVSALATVVVLMLIVLRFGDSSSGWYVVYHGLPGANSIRAIGRVCFVVMLLGLIGGLTALQAVVESTGCSAGRRHLVYVIIFLVLVGEQICVKHDSFDRDEFYPRARELARQFTDADAVYVEYSARFGPKDRHEILAMWAGLYANVPMVNGYSGREPPYYEFIHLGDQASNAREMLGNDWQGQLLVVSRDGPVTKRFFDIRPANKSVD